ncbi:MAG: GNAT family N-acetyltransferase [Actinobacteria bacterium]|nr:GNAT family N-acetyltransferase [Actinomycetota bacterium]
MKLTRVTSSEQIEAVAALAQEIWNQHFVPIIGQEQVDYMLEKFQSAPAIAGQISGGNMYYLIEVEGQAAGYFALAPVPEQKDELQLSKIYVRDDYRGCGLGSDSLEFVEALCGQMGIRELWLTVNRNNSATIEFYRRRGFTIESEVVQEIGGGFVMDDFRMTRTIPKSRQRPRCES